MISKLFIFAFIILVSFVLTAWVRRYSLNKNIIDTPNARSSHIVPIPRGGGAAIVITFLASLIFVDELSVELFWSLFGSGFVVAAIGFWDDHGHIPAKWRLLAHFVAVLWTIHWLGGISTIHFLNYSIEIGWLGIGLVVLSIVWLLNLFNFMDGIDGIAGSEAVFVALGGAVFCWLMGLEGIAWVAFFLALSVMGFLILNWPPAKIFMGDVGSGFLGLILGIIAYASIQQGLSLYVWLILLGIFLIDSTFTLLKRFVHGEKWYEAHCCHAYQYAARRWGHLKVTLAVCTINFFWLFPFAFFSYLFPDWGLIFLVIAFTPLLFVAMLLKTSTFKK